MSIMQEYALDACRARQHGEPVVPAPGAHDWQVIRELRDHRHHRAALVGRPARGRLRSALLRRLRPTR
ncbi:hypothetical protein [Streptomyces asoensis]|uniref:hypothetical protein n=1 Tax=Streptomyces asoensis TaxID=249586 RepID=UPI0033F7230C